MKQPATVMLMAGALAIGAALGGCHTRTLEITSDPPGALVWLNDEQVGRTPLETDFVHYGTYDVRIRLDGYQPVATHRTASASFAEQPGIDFVTESFPGRTVTHWFFTLEPLPEIAARDAAESAAFDRARAFRDHVTGVSSTPEPLFVPNPPQETPNPPAPADPTPPPQPTGPAGTPTTVTPSGTSPSTTAPAPTTPK